VTRADQLRFVNRVAHLSDSCSLGQTPCKLQLPGTTTFKLWQLSRPLANEAGPGCCFTQTEIRKRSIGMG